MRRNVIIDGTVIIVAIMVPRNAISRIESLGCLLSDTFKISKMVIKTEYVLSSILFS